MAEKVWRRAGNPSPANPSTANPTNVPDCRCPMHRARITVAPVSPPGHNPNTATVAVGALDISGHANLDGTSVYLSMTPELLHGVSLRACPSCGRRNCARSPENPKRRGNPLCAHPMRGARTLSDRRSRRDRSQDRRASRSKNRLFAGSEGGGPTWATVVTLLQTAKMNGVDTLAWSSQTLIRIAQRWPVPKSKCSYPGISS